MLNYYPQSGDLVCTGSSLPETALSSLRICPSFHADGNVSVPNIFPRRLQNRPSEFLQASISSPGIPSGPAAYPLFNFLIAILIPSVFGDSVSISGSYRAASINGGSSGGGQLNKSEKASFHLDFCPSPVFCRLPCMSLMGV